jgi:glyceraldehyde 3-phosphate dehydrogenase
MPTRIAINGFGRIGRAVVRAAHERQADITVVAVNDVADPHTLAALLARDSVYGRFPGTVGTHDGFIDVDGHGIIASADRDPAGLPWAEYDIDVVIEATGRFRTRPEAAKHLEAGAKKVILSAPMKGDEPADANLVLGVNDDVYDPEHHHIVTNASCTTNCLAPIAKVLHETVGIRHGVMTTIHAYTADQNLLDGPHKDLRRARAAAINIIPTTTGAAKAAGIVLPHLKGKLDGISMRVPVPDGSVTDLVATVRGDVSKEAVNEAFRAAADSGPLTGKLVYTEDPIVSSDIVGTPASCTFDALSTMVMGSTVKIVGWYDNEWGYSNRLVDLVRLVASSL